MTPSLAARVCSQQMQQRRWRYLATWQVDYLLGVFADDPVDLAGARFLDPDLKRSKARRHPEEFAPMGHGRH
jgi:hypothetical protein